MDIDDDDDEAAMQAAMLLSMGGTPSNAPKESASAAAPAVGTFMDNDFVNQLLGSVDVDPNDPFIAAAREQLDAATEEQKKNMDKKEDSK